MKSTPSEEKVADGIYITKCEKKPLEKPIEKTDEKPKYFYRSTADLINILETQFEEIEKQIEMLYHANEEMAEYDPNDYDLIEARQENLEIINKKLLKLKELQDELRVHCPTNPFVLKDVFELFLHHKKEKPLKEQEDNKQETDIVSNVNTITTINNQSISNTNNTEDVTTEIEL